MREQKIENIFNIFKAIYKVAKENVYDERLEYIFFKLIDIKDENINNEVLNKLKNIAQKVKSELDKLGIENTIISGYNLDYRKKGSYIY